MLRLCLSTLAAVIFLQGGSALALGLSDRDIYALCSKAYSPELLKTIKEEGLSSDGLRLLISDSDFYAGIGGKGHIFLKDSRTKLVYRLDGDGVFRYAQIVDFQGEIIYASNPRSLAIHRIQRTGGISQIEAIPHIQISEISKFFWAGAIVQTPSQRYAPAAAQIQSMEEYLTPSDRRFWEEFEDFGFPFLVD